MGELRVIEPRKRERDDVIETLKEAVERAGEVDSMAVAVVLLAPDGAIHSHWSGRTVDVLGSIEVLRKSVADTLEE